MRKAFFYAICMAAAFIPTASCNKIEEKSTSVGDDERTVINGVAESIGNGTKAYNAYCYEVRWQEKDEIYVTQSDGTDDLFVLEDGVDTPKGKFVEKGIKGITGGIEAFYPASLKTDDGYVWPAVQTNSQVAPMYAKQTISGIGAETVSFSSLGAMLQIVFNSVTPDITVTSVTIKDADKPMSGRFTVETDQDGGALAVIDDDAENVGITLDLGAGVEMGKSAKYFYMAILAGQYSNLTLTFTASNGMVCEMKSSTFPSVERNTVGRLTLSGEFKNVVRFDLNGKGTAETDYKLLVPGSLCAIPAAPTAEGYEFDGWYKDNYCQNEWNFATDKVNGNITLYAKWVKLLSSLKGHDCVKLAGYHWAVENVESAGSVPFVALSAIYGGYYLFANAASAAQVWGGSSDYEWILPTADIWQTLLDRCDWVRVDGYNYKGNMVSGMLVTGREDKGETGNSIFLPAGGHYYSDEHKDSATYYASPDVTGGKTHIYLWFKDGAVMRSNGSSYDAALVRPVAVPRY